MRHRQAARPITIDKSLINSIIHFLVPEIEKWLRRRPDQDSPIGSVRNIAKDDLRVETADGYRSRNVKVYVHARPAGSKIKGVGLAVVGGKAQKYSDNTFDIQLFINGDLSPKEYLVPREFFGQPVFDRMGWRNTSLTNLPHGLYMTLMHEVTHIADFLLNERIKQTYSSKEVEGKLDSDPSVLSMYYNDPLEVRAKMQEIADDAVRLAKQLRPLVDGSNQRLMDTILRLSSSWQEIEKELTPRNRALILKAVYTELDDRDLLFADSPAPRIASRYARRLLPLSSSSNMSDLRSRLVRLAYARSDLRPHLLPLLR